MFKYKVIIMLITIIFLANIHISNADSGIKVFIDNKEIVFEEQEPVIVDGRALVPGRKILESIGYKVVWDALTQKVTAENESEKIELCVNNKMANVNDEDIQMDVAIQLLNDKIMVSLGFIAEKSDAYVLWNDKDKIIEITTNIPLYLIKQKNKYGYINKYGEVIVKPKYDKISKTRYGISIVQLNEKYGYIDNKGKEITKIKYERACGFSDGLARVFLEDRYGYINTKGIEVIEPQFIESDHYDSKVYDFNNGIACIQLNGKWWYIDKEGNQLKYDYVGDFEDGLACVGIDNKYGLVNKQWKEVICLIYDSTLNFSKEGLSVAKKDGKCGFINKEGKVVIPFIYDSATNFLEGLAIIREDQGYGYNHSHYGYINMEGQQIIPCKYDVAFDFHDGIAEVNIDSIDFYINKNGKEITLEKYDDFGRYIKGGIRVKQGDKFGYINKYGDKITEIKYDYASEEIGIVKANGKYGLLNPEGKEITEIKYDDINDFSTYHNQDFSDHFAVKYNGLYGIVNKDGNLISETKYDCVWDYSNGFAVFEFNGKYGYIDETGKEVTELKYEDANDFDKYGVAEVIIGTKQAYINRNGLIIWEEK
ncbi:MAG TPA: hypothetical protein DEP72_04190 [Clostridiales bacterium]|nr:MAG: hypothetical protein A2Y18_08100 [Clostridiales bacterium GWD2_32_19]HCC07340.1 hypothetical protein [Clostridiales bacterium]